MGEEFAAALFIGRMDHEMCRLTAELLNQAELTKGLARRARNYALQCDTARGRARMLQHAVELEELATQLVLQVKKLLPNAARTLP